MENIQIKKPKKRANIFEYNAAIKEAGDQISREEKLSDDDNPKYLYSTINTSLLSKIAKGEIDPKELAIKELENRGQDINGKWVGFNKKGGD